MKGKMGLMGLAVVLSATVALGGIRADLSGDAVVDFQTTMDMPFMNVGNRGNAADTLRMRDDTTGYGAVDYSYNIGKFEVTAGQYAEFLNAVAATDTYGLYSTKMWAEEYGCKIDRLGSDGSYTYAVATDQEDRPVNLVGWGDAARFANWLTNGMPTGAQDLTTTEDGSYFLNGATTDAALLAIMREPDARYVIPTEDEWYKAAYHKNDGVTGNYFKYPTGSDTRVNNDLIDPDPGNNANFYDSGFTIDSPYYRTEAGEFELSQSPYDTFDMGGNVWEWNEAIVFGVSRGLRGGIVQQGLLRRPRVGPLLGLANVRGLRLLRIPRRRGPRTGHIGSARPGRRGIAETPTLELSHGYLSTSDRLSN